MNEKTYPIYTFSAKWHQDETEYSKWEEKSELPQGRVWNVMASFYKMYKTEQPQHSLDLYILKWWDNCVVNKATNITNPSTPILKAEYKEHETWVLTWFQHETFDVGQSN